MGQESRRESEQNSSQPLRPCRWSLCATKLITGFKYFLVVFQLVIRTQLLSLFICFAVLDVWVVLWNYIKLLSRESQKCLDTDRQTISWVEEETSGQIPTIMSRLSSPCTISWKKRGLQAVLGGCWEFPFPGGTHRWHQARWSQIRPVRSPLRKQALPSYLVTGGDNKHSAGGAQQAEAAKITWAFPAFTSGNSCTGGSWTAGIETRERGELLPGGLQGFLPLICAESRGLCLSLCSFTRVAALVLLHDSKAGMQAVPLVRGQTGRRLWQQDQTLHYL